MTRKHFQMIADAIAWTMVEGTEKTLLIERLCEAFGSTNAAFNRQKFINACKEVVT